MFASYKFFAITTATGTDVYAVCDKCGLIWLIDSNGVETVQAAKAIPFGATAVHPRYVDGLVKLPDCCEL